jgi:phenylacetate-coenzyme A ligase PaaK-like adenylate-forming protein
MYDLEEFFKIAPFSLEKQEKNILFNKYLKVLTQHHYNNCNQYKKIIDTFQFNIDNFEEFSFIPSLPVRLFKLYELYSVEKSEILKTMTSSGTSGQSVSKIFLDKTTSINQTKVLSKILSDFLGTKRLPMLIIDSKNVLKDRNSFSARGAGILGFTMFGTDVTYALNENMEIDFDIIDEFVNKHFGKEIFIFGFTSIIWEYLYKVLVNKNKKINIPNGIMLHGGGWKKLEKEAVNSDIFKSNINNVTGIKKIYNYYGMIEQTGSIFMECEFGNFHCSNYSDVEVLDSNFSNCSIGEKGILKLTSLLPYSYPGHILLTEDEGKILGEDNCLCGRKGKYFKVYGRIKDAEIRGCSDTYENN